VRAILWLDNTTARLIRRAEEVHGPAYFYLPALAIGSTPSLSFLLFLGLGGGDAVVSETAPDCPYDFPHEAGPRPYQ